MSQRRAASDDDHDEDDQLYKNRRSGPARQVPRVNSCTKLAQVGY